MIRRNPRQEPSSWVDAEEALGSEASREPLSPKPADPYRKRVVLFIAVLALTLSAIVVAMVLVTELRRLDEMQLRAEGIGGTPATLAAGRHVFRTNCAMCHAQDGGGAAGLGKPLCNSEFVGSNEDLFNLIVACRPADHHDNTTGVAMPARGLERLPDEQIWSVVSYLRSLQGEDEPATGLEAPLSHSIEPFVPPITGTGVIGQFRTVASPGIGLITATASSAPLVPALFFHRRAYLPLVNGEIRVEGTERS